MCENWDKEYLQKQAINPGCPETPERPKVNPDEIKKAFEEVRNILYGFPMGTQNTLLKEVRESILVERNLEINDLKKRVEDISKACEGMKNS